MRAARRVFTWGRLLALGLILLAVVVVLAVYPSNYYIFLPDKAHPAGPAVFVPGGHEPAKGGVYYVDVLVEKATLLERLFNGWPHSGADLYPANEVNPPGVNSTEQRVIDLEDMQQSQQVAAAVALRASGRKVRVTPIGAQVEEVGTGFPAVGKLAPDDIITAIDGTRVTGTRDVYDLMAKHKPGATVVFTIRRGTRTLNESITTTHDPQDPKRAIVGIVVTQAADIHLPVPVRIDVGNVGGPSAGLAFALEVMQKLGANVVHGLKIAATGTISLDGSVGEIGGIRQKTIGAHNAGVDAFLVPVGNAAAARKAAHGLRIVAVKSFQQALRVLKTLPAAS